MPSKMPRTPNALRNEPSANRWNPYVKAGCALLIAAWINGVAQFIVLVHQH